MKTVREMLDGLGELLDQPYTGGESGRTVDAFLVCVVRLPNQESRVIWSPRYVMSQDNFTYPDGLIRVAVEESAADIAKYLRTENVLGPRLEPVDGYVSLTPKVD